MKKMFYFHTRSEIDADHLRTVNTAELCSKPFFFLFIIFNLKIIFITTINLFTSGLNLQVNNYFPIFFEFLANKLYFVSSVSGVKYYTGNTITAMFCFLL